MNEIDFQLYRPLKAGKEFEKLIPHYKGIDHSFDKKGDNSDTFDSLRFMAEWAQKYANQMSKVAPKLNGRNLQETAKKIYDFLYHHFQYRIDEELQNLYSPSAAWHFREKGFDCKTYSILASTILQNLQIPHAFRMVQQAGMAPDRWSHVYVIVPSGNNHYVIDATTHSNKEVSFTKKYDYIMKHRGLASPHVQFNGLGCACSGKPLSHAGLGSPDVLSNTIKNFHSFLNVLEKQGISRTVTDKMVELVKMNVNMGIDPNMTEITAKAFQMTGAGSLNSPASYRSKPNGLGASLLDGISLSTVGGSGGGGLKVGGIDVGATAAQLATGNYVGAAIGVLKTVIPIDKTFGAVFKNGFKVDCWGSTLTPSQTKGWAQNDIPKVYAETLGRGVTEANLHAFIDAMNWVKTQSESWAKDMKSCSKDALKNYGDAAIAAKLEVITKAKEVLNLTPIGSVTVNTKLPFTFSHKNFNVYDKPYSSERFSIATIQQAQEQPVQQYAPTTVKPAAVSTTVDQTGAKITTVTSPDGSQVVTKTDVNGNVTAATTAPAKSSNIGTILTIGSAVALAAKLLL
ncbi:transglutaminase domain-containing protein [Flavobacterium fluviatile]|uniref:transglutaminase domain-containing protein n=1 Tax=Flavobacterium fluviatile TaxID=1862387 RepID=UPI0013D0DBE2|nr:transglutaminase domain-containing protein [Flavobacterium fluviatile]